MIYNETLLFEIFNLLILIILLLQINVLLIDTKYTIIRKYGKIIAVILAIVISIIIRIIVYK